MMATGDYHSTALAVARDVGMVVPGGQVFIIQKGSVAKPARLGSLTSAMRSDKPGQQGHSVGGFWRSVSFAEQERQYSGSEHQGLLCQAAGGRIAPVDALHALKAIAEVRLAVSRCYQKEKKRKIYAGRRGLWRPWIDQWRPGP